MKNVFSTGHKLLTGLTLLLLAGSLMAESSIPATYVKPDTDLAKYKRVLVKPLNMVDIEILKPAWEQDNDEVWVFKAEASIAVQEWFMDAMQLELETNGGYAMVSESADDVLRIEVELLSITPYVKPGTRAGDINGHVISTLGSGDLVVSAEFRDSQTRELLILVEGERTIGSEYKELSYENHVANLKAVFEEWGSKIRKALDEAHGK